MTSDANDDQASSPSGLDEFANHNPHSEVVVVGQRITVRLPWGDATLAMRVAAHDRDLLDDLNMVVLPRRLTALIHRDTGLTEFLGGVTSRQSPLLSRAFTFTLDGKEYACRFGESSERAIRITRHTNPIGPETTTSYRNVPSYHIFAATKDDADSSSKGFASNHLLYSFYVSGLPSDEDEYISVLRNLNFCTAYVDRSSPIILIHDVVDSGEDGDIAAPQLFETFPERLDGTSRSQYLLTLWASAHSTADPVRKLLHAYQILEYAAFYFISQEVRSTLERILAAPDIRTFGSPAASRIMDLIPTMRMEDEAKINATVKEAVAPEYLWREVEVHRSYFVQDQSFEGGFQIGALIDPQCSYDEFQKIWHPKVPDAIRHVRNAVVHAREQRMSKTIAPTQANLRKLTPWAHLAMAVATQVVLQLKPT